MKKATKKAYQNLIRHQHSYCDHWYVHYTPEDKHIKIYISDDFELRLTPNGTWTGYQLDRKD